MRRLLGTLGLARRCGALAAFALVAACAHQNGSAASPGSGPPAASGGQVGYVSLERLVKKHPLYPQLSRLDQDMEALRLKSVASSVAVSPADLQRAQNALQHELEAAANHAQATIKQKQRELQTRENAAIAAAIGAAAPAGGSIASGIDRQLTQQQQRVRTEAASDFDSYRSQVIAQDRASLAALQGSYDARAGRQFRARQNALQQAEASYALRLADDDKAERLSLRTKLSNLPLDDTEREATRARLETIDRRESDALGAMRNRDQATLADLQTALHGQIRREVGAATAEIRAKTVAKIQAHARTTQQIASSAAGGGIAVTAAGAGLPADMKQRLAALQTKFQADFTSEASRTVADFEKTKRDLTTRFEKLRGLDAASDAGAQRQIGALSKQRGDLYDQMVAQIQREVRSVAQKRGIDVVFSDVVAPAGGVDLTADAEKDIESLPQ